MPKRMITSRVNRKAATVASAQVMGRSKIHPMTMPAMRIWLPRKAVACPRVGSTQHDATALLEPQAARDRSGRSRWPIGVGGAGAP
jgi:hypothetical protein